MTCENVPKNWQLLPDSKLLKSSTVNGQRTCRVIFLNFSGRVFKDIPRNGDDLAMMMVERFANLLSMFDMTIDGQAIRMVIDALTDLLLESLQGWNPLLVPH